MYTDIIQKLTHHIRSAPARPIDTIGEAVNRHGIDAERDEHGPQNWLARYVAGNGNAPSAIQFHRARLGRYWRYTLHQLSIRSEGESTLALMLAWMVFAHEQYHWIRHSIRDKQDESLRHREEALATGWAWRVCQLQGASFGMSPQLVEAVARLWFEHITARGYADWHQFAHPCSFSFDSLAFLRKDIPVSAVELSMRACFYNIVDGSDDNNLEVVDAWQDKRVASLAFEINASALRHRGYSISPYHDEIDLSGRGLATVEAVSRAVAAWAPSRSAGPTILCLCHNMLASLQNWPKDGDKDNDVKRTRVLRNAKVHAICFRHQSSGSLPIHLLGPLFTDPRPGRLFFDDPNVSEILTTEQGSVHDLQEMLIDAGYEYLAREFWCIGGRGAFCLMPGRLVPESA